MNRLPALVGLMRHGALKPCEIFEIMGGDIDAAASALNEAHRRGIVREDRKNGALKYRLDITNPRALARMTQREGMAK